MTCMKFPKTLFIERNSQHCLATALAMKLFCDVYVSSKCVVQWSKHFEETSTYV